jgi:hypothetical protein
VQDIILPSVTAKFFEGISCKETRRILRSTLSTYYSLMGLLPLQGSGYFVECGPGCLSIPALALNLCSTKSSVTYMGLERDAANASKLRKFLAKHSSNGLVSVGSILDPNIDTVLPKGIGALCFEHALEDIVLGVLADILEIEGSEWSSVVDVLAARIVSIDIEGLVSLCLNRILDVALSLPDDRSKTACIFHHFCSPGYGGQRSNLYLLDREVVRVAKILLTSRFRPVLCFHPRSGLPEEFWWLGYPQ